MKYLSFESNSCKDCYSCLRKCPVKAIRFVDNKAEIVEENCILCGHCAEGVSMMIDQEPVYGVNAENVDAIFAEKVLAQLR